MERRRWVIGAIWGIFLAILLSLVFCDLDANPILDEQQWLQGGLGAAHHKFLKTGFVSGPFYCLALGILFIGVYGVGLLFGAFTDQTTFLVWFFSHQSVFYLIARLLTVSIVVAGLILFARELSRRVGGGWASCLTISFSFTFPALLRIPYATPHAAMIGYSAALLFVLMRAEKSESRWWWVAAGAIVSLAFTTITVGIGLLLLAAVPAIFLGEGRGRRIGWLSLGVVGGFLLFGFPILLHLREYWEFNIAYQFNRQVTTTEGGQEEILRVWGKNAFFLFLLAIAGTVRGKFSDSRSLRLGAFFTALSFVVVLAFFTQSKKADYSLAIMPCLAYCAAGLVPDLSKISRNGLIVGSLFLFSPTLLQAGIHIYQRWMVPDRGVAAAEKMIEVVPARTTVLIDSWWGPRLQNSNLLLAPYGRWRELWQKKPEFTFGLMEALPPEHNQWKVVLYPQDVNAVTPELLEQHGIEYVVISKGMMNRAADREEWGKLLEERVLLPIEEGHVRFYRVDRK